MLQRLRVAVTLFRSKHAVSVPAPDIKISVRRQSCGRLFRACKLHHGERRKPLQLVRQRTRVSHDTKAELTLIVQTERKDVVIVTTNNCVRTATFNSRNILARQRKVRVEGSLDGCGFTIAALTVLVATEAHELVQLLPRAEQHDGSVLESARDLLDLLLALIDAIDELRGLHNLTSVFAGYTRRFHVNTSLKVSTRTPTVKSVAGVDSKAVASTRCYFRHTDVL